MLQIHGATITDTKTSRCKNINIIFSLVYLKNLGKYLKWKLRNIMKFKITYRFDSVYDDPV
jgi:hypothetical protein